MKMSKKSFVLGKKVLDLWVILMMLLQPISAPGVLVAIAQDEQTAQVENVAPAAPASETKTPETAPVKQVEPVVAPVEEKAPVVAAEAEKVAPVVEAAPASQQLAVPAETIESPLLQELASPFPASSEPAAGQIQSQTPQPSTGQIDSQAASIVKSLEIWSKDGNKATTIEAVDLGKTYVAPQNDQVTVTFTKLPEKSGKLSVEEITLSDEQVALLGALSNKAYDITSDMADGTFEYTMTLPTKSNVDPEKVNIIYAENAQELSDTSKIKTVDENKNAVSVDTNKDEVKVETLDHFTIFILTYSDATLVTTKTSYRQGETVYMKAGELVTGNYYRFAIDPPGNNNLSYITTCQQPNSSHELSSSYVLASDATIGVNNWTAEIHGFNSEGNCQNANSTHPASATQTFSVTAPSSVSNPALAQACGLDIALVLDNSTSISSSEMTQMKNAMTSFTNALNGTPTQFSVIHFATTASIDHAFTSSVADTNSAITGIPVGGGYTNWQDGLTKAQSTFDPRLTKPSLVIFASDGNPNTVIGGSAGGASEAQAVTTAQVVANALKASGTRVLAIGIGTDLNSTNMEAISGTNVNTGNVLTSDLITTNFDGLAGQLAEFAKQTCGGKISVNKYVDGIQKSDGKTWSFLIDGATKITTDTNGQVASGTLSVGNHTISETDMQSGYSFNHATCSSGIVDPSNPGYKNIAVTADSIITCSFFNTTNKGSITLVKKTVGGDGTFGFATSTGLSPANPNITTLNGTGSQAFNGLTPGTYSISENVPVGWDLSSAVCSDNSPVSAISLQADENITCIFTNAKLSIDVSKTANPTSVPENGGNVTFTVRVSNPSAVSVNLTSLNDDKFGKLNGQGNCVVPTTITAGGYYECAFTKFLASDTLTSHTDVVTAVASGASDTDDATVTFNDVKPTIEVTKTAGVASVDEPGGNVTYTFTVKNTGTAEAVTITSLADDKFGDLVGDADCKIGTVLATGASCSFDSTQAIAGEAGTSHTNIFTASAVDNENNKASDEASATVTFNDVKPSVTIEKSVDNATLAEPGGAFNYTLRITNNSVEAITIKSLADDNALSPTCLALVGSSLAAGASTSCTYSVSHSVAGTYLNKAIVTVKDNENNEASDDDSKTVKVVGAKISFNQLEAKNNINDKHTFIVTVNKNDGSGYVPAVGEHVDVTLTNGGDANAVVDVTQSTCDNAGSNTDVNGQCLVVFNSATPGTITASAKVDLTISGQNIHRETDGTLGSSVNAVKTYVAGKIIVEKQTLPDGSTQTFEFTPSYGNKFSLSDNGTNDSGYLAPGTYSVSESIPTGWEQTTAVCGNQSSVSAITLRAGETVTCTFTNSKKGKITIVKDAQPNSGQDFKFEGNLNQGAFYLDDDSDPTLPNSKTFENLSLATYTITEDLSVAGWELKSVNCAGGSDTNTNNRNAVITLKPAEDVICTFVNTRDTGDLKAQKIVDDQTNLSQWYFSLDGAPAVQANSSGQVDFGQVTTLDNHTIVESGPAGYHTASIACSQEGSSVDLGAESATTKVTKGGTTICTFNNEVNKGNITIIKDAVPNDQQDFTFTALGKSVSGFTLDDDGNNTNTYSNTKQFAGLFPGDYTFTESSVTGWDLAGLTCVESGAKNSSTNLDNRKATIHLDAGETVTCTYTNTKQPGKVIVQKFVKNDDGGTKVVGDFGISFAGGALTFNSGVSQSGGKLYTSNPVTIDADTNYTLSEPDTFGYVEGKWDCGTTSNSGRTTSLSVLPGKTTTCKITNDDQPGKLKVIKQVDNTNGGDKGINSFDLEVNNANVTSGSWNTFDANKNLAITEEQVPGYSRESVVCSSTVAGSANNSNENVLPKVVKLANGEEVTCTILNKSQFGHIIIKKETLPDGDKTQFEFDPNWGWRFDLRDGESKDSGILVPGTYSIHEHNENGWDQTSVVCSDGSDPSRINVGPAETVTCTFTNTKRAEVTIKKDAIPDDSQDFTFSNNFGDGIPSNFTLDDDGWDWWPGHSNEQTFSVKPGTYSVVENPLAGWKQESVVCSDGIDAANFQATAGARITCTFTNKKLGKINLVKKAIGDDGSFDFAFSGLGEGSMNFKLATTNGNATQTFLNIDPDKTYGISESSQDGWNLTNASCVNEKGEGKHEETDLWHWFDWKRDEFDNEDQINPASFEINPGGEMTCTFSNTKQGRIIVNKETNPDQSESELKEVFIFNSSWGGEEGSSFELSDNGSNDSGWLAPNKTYSVNEQAKESWKLSDVSCVSSISNNERKMIEDQSGEISPNEISLHPGETVTCTFTNDFVIPKLLIEKTNDATIAKKPGEKVKYTLKVTAPGMESEEGNQSDLHNVTVTDLPPTGFTYISGSAVGAPFIHEYASPGVWDLGTMAPGEVKILTYETTIDGEQDPGLYNDTAFAKGTTEITTEVLANKADSDPFVGTQVAVIEPIQTMALGEKTIIKTKTETKTKTKKEYVLGAELPATGANALWTLFGALTMVAGITLLIIRKRRMSKNNLKTVLAVMCLVFASLLASANKASAAVSVQIQQPDKLISSEEYPIGFVALGTDPTKSMTVKCFVKGDPAAFYTHTFDPIDSDKASGNSGNCILNTTNGTVIPNSDGGSYQFYVTATDGIDTKDSNPTTPVIVDIVGPQTPINYVRNNIDACSKQISFTTANDGQTARVELYRSASLSFPADASTFVNDQIIAPNTIGSFSDIVPDCSQTYYYVVRALDVNGNESAFVGDENVTVTTKTKTHTQTKTKKITVENVAKGAIPVDPQLNQIATVAGQEATSPEQASQVENGEVLGDETTLAKTPGVLVAFAEKALPWLLLATAGILIKRRNDKKTKV